MASNMGQTLIAVQGPKPGDGECLDLPDPALRKRGDGFDLIMGDGIIRARYRESDRKEKLMNPGEIYQFEIKLDPCSNVFKKGHRLRVDISSSNFPRFDVNPNSGEPANDYRQKITATNTIHHDSEHPSHIILPLLESSKFERGEITNFVATGQTGCCRDLQPSDTPGKEK